MAEPQCDFCGKRAYHYASKPLIDRDSTKLLSCSEHLTCLESLSLREGFTFRLPVWQSDCFGQFLPEGAPFYSIDRGGLT